MSEEDLELLITLDEPWDGHEDTFNHLQADNTVGYRPSAAAIKEATRAANRSHC